MGCRLQHRRCQKWWWWWAFWDWLSEWTYVLRAPSEAINLVLSAIYRSISHQIGFSIPLFQLSPPPLPTISPLPTLVLCIFISQIPRVACDLYNGALFSQINSPPSQAKKSCVVFFFAKFLWFLVWNIFHLIAFITICAKFFFPRAIFIGFYSIIIVIISNRN